MQNPPTAGSRGACQLGGDSAPYTPDQHNAQTATTVPPRCVSCRHFLDYRETSKRGECRRYAPRLVDPYNDQAAWAKTSTMDWCGEWEAGR